MPRQQRYRAGRARTTLGEGCGGGGASSSGPGKGALSPQLRRALRPPVSVCGVGAAGPSERAGPGRAEGGGAARSDDALPALPAGGLRLESAAAAAAGGGGAGGSGQEASGEKEGSERAAGLRRSAMPQ